MKTKNIHEAKTNLSQLIELVEKGKEIVIAWEILLKKSIGKLHAPHNLEAELLSHEFTKLPILFSHVAGLEKLRWIHKDPFDRIMLAQSVVENLSIVTRDPRILSYPLAFLKA